MMWLTKTAAFMALRLSSGHAQEYSGDLSTLAGLTDSEIAEKFASDPVLLKALLRAANIKVGNVRRSSSPRSTEDAAKPFAQEAPVPVYDTFEDTSNATQSALNLVDMMMEYPHGFEYLGLGYNILTGNPRGSSSSELDPGFGFPVLNLAASSSTKTRSFAYPAVSYMKGSKACTFSEESSEISSTKDYQDDLSKESTSDTSISAGFSVFGATFSSTTAFSRSEKMQEFQQERETSNTVSFESMAKCTELSVHINPYEELTLNPTFEAALSALPDSYDRTDAASKMQYEKFLGTYGTHYITQLDMGGKLVVTNEISATDVMSLTRSNVDISSTLSFETSFSFAHPGGGIHSPTAQANEETRKELLKPVCCEANLTSPFDALSPEAKTGLGIAQDGTGPAQAAADVVPFGVNAGFTQRNTNRETRTKRDESSVASKVSKSTVYTIGGLPPRDDKWQSWAATVSANPMPVSYRHVPLWTLPEFDAKAGAFFEAVEHIYGVDLRGNTAQKEVGLRYGVAAASGTAISRYSLDPDQTRRAYLELGLLPSSELATDTVVVYHKDDLEGPATKWTGFVGPSKEGFFACGLRARFSNKRPGEINGGGISGLDVRFCSKDDWFDQEQKIVYRSYYGGMRPWRMCDARQYIVQIQPAVEINDHVNALDIETLNMKCADLEGKSPETFSNDGFVDIVPNPRHGERTPVQPSKIIPGKVIRSFRIEYGGHKDLVRGIEMKVTSAEEIIGPSSPVYYYDCYWDLRSAVVSALFATPIRGRVGKSAYESKQLSFISPMGMLAIESSSHYTYFEDPERPKIAITDFKSDIEEEDLPSLSFLVTRTGLIDESHSSSIIAGAVHPDRYGFGSVEYQVADEDGERPNVVTLILKGIAEDNSHVTLLTSPLWLPSSNARFPENAGDVATASAPCVQVGNEWKCSVHVGAVESVAAQQHLGFSFLAIGNQVSSEFGVSGSVTMKEGHEVDQNKTTVSDGVTVQESFSSPANFSFFAGEGDVAKFNIKNQRTGGVLLKFDPPFGDVPSIIVSPRLSEEASLSRYSLDVVQMPHVVVEHVTESEALVSAGLLNTFSASVSAVVEECTPLLDLRQTFLPNFIKPGWITIGGRCFTSSNGYVDAVACDTAKPTSRQLWVYDGQRIRSAGDTTMCIWGRGHNQRIALHKCGSDSSAIDDERFTFRDGPGEHISLETQYSRCLFRDGNEVKLSINNDSRCHDGRDAAWNRVRHTEGLSTAGFQLTTSNNNDESNPKFAKCFSGSPTTKNIDPLGNCESSSWLLSLRTDDPNDMSYKLKLGGSNHKTTDLWLARDGDDLYLKKGHASAAQFDVDEAFFNNGPARRGDYSDYRIKIYGSTKNCVAWQQSIKADAEYDVEGLVFEPIGFNFLAIAPTRESESDSNAPSPSTVMAWTQDG